MTKPKEFTYADAGVDVKAGNDISAILYEHSKRTWGNRTGRLGEILSPYEHFSATRYIDVSGLPKGTVMSAGTDGIGTKVLIGQRVGRHNTAGNELVAMSADDAPVRGGEPVLFINVLDVSNTKDQNKRPYIKQAHELGEGLVNACNLADIVAINGELAELRATVTGYGHFNYNWSGGVIWFANKERILTGDKIQEGDSIVGLYEPGLRANGISLVRNILEETKGENWHLVNHPDGQTYGELALTPSIIYTKAVVDMFGGWDLERNPKAEIHGIAHITGGGLPEKLGRTLLPTGLGAIIDQPFNTPEFMKEIQRLGNVPDREAYETWCMGCGMAVITPEPEKVIETAKQHGIHSDRMGKVIKPGYKATPSIKLENNGAFSSTKPGLIDFPIAA